MNNLTLNNGVTLPTLGLGVFQSAPEETAAAVETALHVGYRHIDTAAAYGNEREVGEGLRRSGVDRDDVFLETKIWPTDYGYEKTLHAFEKSAGKLGVDTLDLLILHQPIPSRFENTIAAFKALETLLADGRVRAIGVSNFMPHHLDALLEGAHVVPAVNQFEVHPTHQQRAAQAASAAAGIVVEAYAPIGKGEDLAEAAVVAVAEAHGVSPAQAVIRWHLQQGRVVIPKSVTPERIAANADVFGFTLTDAEMDAITALERGNRLYPDPDEFANTQFRS